MMDEERGSPSKMESRNDALGSRPVCSLLSSFVLLTYPQGCPERLHARPEESGSKQGGYATTGDRWQIYNCRQCRERQTSIILNEGIYIPSAAYP